MQNSQGVVPIFTKEGTFAGLWARNPNFTIDKWSLAELFSLADITLKVLTHEKTRIRRVPCLGLTVRGDNQFPGGVFIMINDQLAPSEAMSQGITEYEVRCRPEGLSYLMARS